MTYFLFSILFFIAAYLLYSVNRLSKKIDHKEPASLYSFDDTKLYLKEMPTIHDLDLGGEMIKSVIETAMDENWKCDLNKAFYTSESYEFKIKNPQNTISISAILSVDKEIKKTHVMLFTITSTLPGCHEKASLTNGDLTYDILVKKYLCSILIENNKMEISNETNRINTLISNIKKELKSVYRSKKIDEILS